MNSLRCCYAMPMTLNSLWRCIENCRACSPRDIMWYVCFLHFCLCSRFAMDMCLIAFLVPKVTPLGCIEICFAWFDHLLTKFGGPLMKSVRCKDCKVTIKLLLICCFKRANIMLIGRQGHIWCVPSHFKHGRCQFGEVRGAEAKFGGSCWSL